MAEDKRDDSETETTHEFGSFHTAFKLEILRSYLPAYTTALTNKRFALHYLDAFAGTGMCTIKLAGENIDIPGSASIAIACEPQFSRMVFIEKSLKRVRALERLRAKAPDRRIDIIRDDANSALPAQLHSMSRARDRGIVFLDPYGMQVSWETLREIASSEIADVWYLFPLSGLYRQASLRADDIDEDKAAALTRILGTEEWRSAFYGRPLIEDLFERTSDVRTVNVPQMLAWVKRRLEEVFPAVADPKPLYQVTESGKQGAPLFALFFAVSNPSRKAIELAMRIGKAVLK